MEILPTIDPLVTIGFQVFWMAIVAYLVIKIIKLRTKISELRIALAPFARMYEVHKDDAVIDSEGEHARLVFKIAYDVYQDR